MLQKCLQWARVCVGRCLRFAAPGVEIRGKSFKRMSNYYCFGVLKRFIPINGVLITLIVFAG